MKAYKSMALPAFNQHVYTSEEVCAVYQFRALRWMMKREINLRDTGKANESGETPLSLATANKRTEVMSLLQ